MRRLVSMNVKMFVAKKNLKHIFVSYVSMWEKGKWWQIKMSFLLKITLEVCVSDKENNKLHIHQGSTKLMIMILPSFFDKISPFLISKNKN